MKWTGSRRAAISRLALAAVGVLLATGCAGVQRNCTPVTDDSEVCERECPPARALPSCEAGLQLLDAQDVLRSPKQYLGKSVAIKARPEVRIPFPNRNEPKLWKLWPMVCELPELRTSDYRPFTCPNVVGVFGPTATLVLPVLCSAKPNDHGGFPYIMACCDVDLDEDIVVTGRFAPYSGEAYPTALGDGMVYLHRFALDDAELARTCNAYEIREASVCRP